ncbi:MAG: YfaZ family outer membrane protein [Pseudomonadota bacterium]
MTFTKTFGKTLFQVGCGAMLLTSTAIATAAELDLGLSNDAVRVGFQSQVPNRDLNWFGNYAHAEDAGNHFDLGILAKGRSNASTGLQEAGLGGKIIFLNGDSDVSGSGVAVGGFVAHRFAEANLLKFRGELFYAPDIISFSDVDGYIELGLRLEYQLLDNADIYAGYRMMEYDIEVGDVSGDLEVQDGLVVGFLLSF